MSTSDQTDLLKLSREQLKQLCRERGHKGYSKCTKPQLVVLLGSETPSKFNPSMMAIALVPPKQDASSSASVSKKRLESDSSGFKESVAKKQKLPNPIASRNSLPMQSSTVSAPSKTKRNSRPAQKPPIVPESSVPPMFTAPATVSLADHQPILPPVSQLLPSLVPNYSLGLPQPPELATESQIPLISQPQNRVVEKQKSGTSFLATDPKQQLPSENGRIQLFKKFLDPRNGVTNNHPASHGPQDTLSFTPLSAESPPPPYLDFSALPVPVLSLIGMPPSISDRKKVRPWSIILSGISDTDRRACILVSRMFRYAGKSVLCSLSFGCLISTLRQSICPPRSSSSPTSPGND